MKDDSCEECGADSGGAVVCKRCFNRLWGTPAEHVIKRKDRKIQELESKLERIKKIRDEADKGLWGWGEFLGLIRCVLTDPDWESKT